MANPWFRLWADMVNDPKWRTIARVSKQKIGDVIAVALHMMTCASNATERGHIEGWSDEDVATALDIDTEQVTAIREAMQGRILDGDYMTGWEKRQPKREREDDSSTDRVRAFRDRQRAETPCNATERQETPREEEIREEEIKKKAETQRATRLPADWSPSDEDRKFCEAERPDLDPDATAARFRDYWIAKPGKDGRKADWPATWRNWVRAERAATSKPGRVVAWWATDETTIAKGAELGMRPNPGESMQQFKGRIQSAIDKSGKPPAPKQDPPAIVSAAEPKRVDMSAMAREQRSKALKAALKTETV